MFRQKAEEFTETFETTILLKKESTMDIFVLHFWTTASEKGTSSRMVHWQKISNFLKVLKGSSWESLEDESMNSGNI